MRALLMAGVVVLGWTNIARADVTYVDTWSFTDQFTNTVVSGTLSGIQNGTNLTPSGLTATVTQSYYPDLQGTFSTDNFGSTYNPNYNEYSAANGVITDSSFLLTNGTNLYLYITTHNGSPYFYPELFNSSNGEDLYNRSTGETFALASTPVPEPASLALLTMSVVGVAAVRRRRAA